MVSKRVEQPPSAPGERGGERRVRLPCENDHGDGLRSHVARARARFGDQHCGSRKVCEDAEPPMPAVDDASESKRTAPVAPHREPSMLPGLVSRQTFTREECHVEAELRVRVGELDAPNREVPGGDVSQLFDDQDAPRCRAHEATLTESGWVSAG